MVLTQDEAHPDELVLEGTTVRPEYEARYPNLQNVEQLTVNISPQGELTTTCLVQGEATECDRSPFAARLVAMEHEGEAADIVEVWDVYNERVTMVSFAKCWFLDNLISDWLSGGGYANTPPRVRSPRRRRQRRAAAAVRSLRRRLWVWRQTQAHALVRRRGWVWALRRRRRLVALHRPLVELQLLAPNAFTDPRGSFECFRPRLREPEPKPNADQIVPEPF